MDTLEVIKQYKEEHGTIPTEVKLMKLLGVTRMTVRDRVKKLIGEGKLVKKYRPNQGHFDLTD